MTIRNFTHEAMATTWEFFVAAEASVPIDEARRAAVREIDVLEGELTRFRPDSDIGRLNTLAAGESTRVGPAAMDCLLLARDVHAATEGAFDITIGPVFACWIGPDGSPRRPSRREVKDAATRCGMHLLDLDPDTMRAGVRADGMQIDLGGIGKGYALDQIGERWRRVFGFTNFLLNAGSSTVLACGPGPDGQGWPVRTGLAEEMTYLRDEALSGSGTAAQGAHIIDPRTGRPASLRRRDHVWVRTPVAAVSDAFSTAFLVLAPDAVAAVCARHPEIQLVHSERSSAPRRGHR